MAERRMVVAGAANAHLGLDFVYLHCELCVRRSALYPCKLCRITKSVRDESFRSAQIYVYAVYGAVPLIVSNRGPG